MPTNQTMRRGMALLAGGVAVLAGIAAALGVLARGDGTFMSVVSVRGGTYDVATNGVYAFNAQRVVAEGVGWDVFTLLVAVPAMLLVTPLVARGSFRGQLFALGLFGYFLYAYLEYARDVGLRAPSRTEYVMSRTAPCAVTTAGGR